MLSGSAVFPQSISVISCSLYSLSHRLRSSSAAQSHFLSQFLLDGGSVSLPQHLYSIHAQAYSDSRAAHLIPAPMADPAAPASSSREDREAPLQEGNAAAADAAVRHVDSSSLSEDDVFYN